MNEKWIKGRIRSVGFLRIFTVAFLVLLAPAGGSNPVRPISLHCGAFINPYLTLDFSLNLEKSICTFSFKFEILWLLLNVQFTWFLKYWCLKKLGFIYNQRLPLNKSNVSMSISIVTSWPSYLLNLALMNIITLHFISLHYKYWYNHYWKSPNLSIYHFLFES